MRETLHPGGQVHERFEVDEDGQRDGSYTRYRADGSVEATAAYRAGKLHGVYEEFTPEGARTIEAKYTKGERNGYWREWVGDVKTLDASYRRGVLQGRWIEVSPDGVFVTKAKYSRGVLDGAFEESRPEEEWTRAGKYSKGKIHGKVTISVGRKTVSRRKWDQGHMVELDGFVPYPVRLDALSKELQRAGAPAAHDPSDPKGEQREGALARLKAYRALCGVPWEHLKLDPELNDLCDAASEVCRANGELSHDPKRPAAMPEARFRQGKKGAGNSNLAGGGTLIGSVDSYMDDSDPSNIDRVGHRRWCLNLKLGVTAFGSDGRYSAMWAVDSSGPATGAPSHIFYPPPGYVPVDMFGPRRAWSLMFTSGAAPALESIVIEIVELDEVHQPFGDPLELDWTSISTTGVGGGPCFVFRPKGLAVEPGVRYRLRLSENGGKSWDHEHLVEFVPSVDGTERDR